jgi:DNA-binding MarR family transcriptional regulator
VVTELSFRILLAGWRLQSEAHSAAVERYPELTTADLNILLLVHTFPDLVATTAARLLGRDKTTVSRTISRLEKEALLSTSLDALDGRRKTLSLTKKGQFVIRPALDRMADVLDPSLSDRTPATHDPLERVLDHVDDR